MKITKSELKKLITEEMEQVQAEQQLNENPAMLAQVVKHLPQIMELIKMLPQLTQMMQSMSSAESSGSTPDVTPASE